MGKVTGLSGAAFATDACELLEEAMRTALDLSLVDQAKQAVAVAVSQSTSL